MNDRAKTVPVIDTSGVQDPAARAALDTVKEITELREGQGRGTVYDKSVTFRDLTDIGLMQQVGVDTGYAVGGGGGDSPRPPTNFNVVQGVWFNYLSWINPTDDDFSHIEVWVNTTNNRSSAILTAIITKPTTEYKHPLTDVFDDHYYWIRAVDYAGNYSTWVPTDLMGGEYVPGVDSLDETITKLLEVMTDSVTESQLYADLNTRLDKIETTETAVATNTSDISDGIAGTWASISSKVQVTVYESDFTIYSATDTYYLNDQVQYSGTKYECIDDNSGAGITGIVPTNTTYWAVFDGLLERTAIAEEQLYVGTGGGGTPGSPASDSLLAQWTVKMNVNDHIAGVGLALLDSGFSQFQILCDEFAVINPGDEGQSAKVPFIVGEVDGVSQVGMNANLVVDGTILARSIGTGQIFVSKMSPDVQDTVLLIVPDWNFSKTVDAADENWWLPFQASWSYGAAFGESGPGFKYTGSGVDGSVGAMSGDGSTHYFLASKGQKVYVEARVYKDASYNGELLVAIVEHDADKVQGTTTTIDIEPTASATWETVSNQHTLVDADCHYIRFTIVGRNATAGTVSVDHLRLLLEPAVNWRSNGDFTKIDGGEIYAKSIQLGGWSTPAIDSYGPIVVDTNFALTTSTTDYRYWSQGISAQIFWGSSEGEDGPGLQLQPDGSTYDCYAYDGDGELKYVPARKGDKFYLEVRAFKWTTYDGTVRFYGVELDVNKNSGAIHYATVNPSTTLTWETISAQFTLTDSDCHFIAFLIRLQGGSTGYMNIDSIEIFKEPAASWRSSADVTKIEGGDIYSSSIQVGAMEATFRESRGPLVLDPTFILTASSSDYSFWNLADAQITWGASSGEGGPGMVITANGTDNWAWAYEGSGSLKYTAARKGDKIYAEVRVRKDATFNGTPSLTVAEYNSSKISAAHHDIAINPSAASTWETLTGQITLTLTSTQWIVIRLEVAGGSAGTISIDSVQVWLEPAANWRNATDVTKIEGGSIATDTITASQIKGNGFGDLTISSGTITISTTVGLKIASGGDIEIQSGGDILVKSGGDIEMQSATGGNQATIDFVGDSRTYSLGVDYDNDDLALWPDTGDQGEFKIGSKPGTGQQRFSGLEAYIGSHIWLRCFGGTGYYSYVDISASDSSPDRPRIKLIISQGGVERNVQFWASSTTNHQFSPSVHKDIDIGGSGIAFDECYADNWNNVADFPYLDKYDDLKVICDIKGSGKKDPKSGLEIIDDNTLPKWLLVKDKHTKNIAYDPDGKPYIALKTAIGLTWGAIRQCSNEIEKIKKHLHKP